MHGKSSRLQRVASLSALTSAALAVSAGAEAAIIYHPTPGLTVSGNNSAMLGLPGGNHLSVKGQSSGRPLRFSTSDTTQRTFFGPHGHTKARLVDGVSNGFGNGNIAASGVSFRTAHGLMAIGKKGQTFNKIGTGAGLFASIGHRGSRINKVAGRITYFYGPRNGTHLIPTQFTMKLTTTRPGYRRHRSGHVTTTPPSAHFYSIFPAKISFSRHSQATSYSPSSYSKEYALFRFDDAGQTDYGWLELSLINNFDTGPILDIIGYAYDNTGAPIKAGAIPEPVHLPLALSAFALGALGLREWRARRKAAA